MATFITTRKKTKAVIRKQGHPTQCKTFIKKSDAIIWARKVESEIERGIFENTTKAKLTAFSKVLDEYYKSCQTRQLKALKFIKSHSRIINQHIGDVKLSDITSECLAQYRDIRLKSVSPATTKLELGIIMRAVQQKHQNWAKEVMLETWQEHMDGVRTKVKVDLPNDPAAEQQSTMSDLPQ